MSRIISSDAQTDAHGAPNADGAAEHLAEAGGATQHTASGVSQPTHDQIAYVSKIMEDYRKEDCKREHAKQSLGAREHEIDMTEQPDAGAIEHHQPPTEAQVHTYQSWLACPVPDGFPWGQTASPIVSPRGARFYHTDAVPYVMEF